MNVFEDIDLFLPQYLSDTSKTRLKEELKSFPADGTKGSVYTTMLRDADYLLQGDGISKALYLSFPDTTIRSVNVIILSNTCDISLHNQRINPCRIMYASIVNLEKYQDALLKHFDKERVMRHINDIKQQFVTQAMYLPKGMKLQYEGVVFFDRAISIPLNEETTTKMLGNRLFTLSDFGFYLFLLKISYHFTRIKERIDRNEGKDMDQDRRDGKA